MEPEPLGSRWAPRARKLALGLLIALVLGGAGLGAAAWLASDELGDPGPRIEPLHEWSAFAMGPLPPLVEVTEEWKLNSWIPSGSLPISGGVVSGDLNRDGTPDLVAVGGGAAVFFGPADEGFELLEFGARLPGEDFTSVGLDDIDGDGWLDILVGAADGDAAIVWGGRWTTRRDSALASIAALTASKPTTGLLGADLDQDGHTDILRLGYGDADAVFLGNGSRELDRTPLPHGARLSLAAEIADIARGDGLEAWVTRDTGWRTGGDSIYRASGRGTWTDVAPTLGVAVEIDGMGVTVADLVSDDSLDVYLSDIGQNDLLAGSKDRFEPVAGAGLGRIRPPGRPDDVVSSSWASGVGDFNLDGRLDLVVANGGFIDYQVPNKIKDTDIQARDSPSLFLGDGAGRFADVWSQVEVPFAGILRGMTIVDLDDDGDADLVFVDQVDGLTVLRNDSAGRSLAVSHVGSCSPSGAAVSIDVEGSRTYALLASHTFLGAHARELIVGIGGAETASVSIAWPSGSRTSEIVPLDGGRRTSLAVSDPRCGDRE